MNYAIIEVLIVVFIFGVLKVFFNYKEISIVLSVCFLILYHVGSIHWKEVKE